jgi:hypothetical protein
VENPVKYAQIIAVCDMTRAQTGEVTPAAETVYIAFGGDPRNLKIRELDLSEEWSKDLHEFLLPYLNASHEPGDLITPGTGGHPADDKPAGTREFNRARVDWAQAAGYKITKMIRGGYYVPVKTRKAYAHHLAGRDDQLTEANGLQPDYDPATGNPS